MPETIVRDSVYTAELKKHLLGYTFVGTAIDLDEDGEEFYGMIFWKNNKRKILWILRDMEGNGPGGFQIQELEEFC